MKTFFEMSSFFTKKYIKKTFICIERIAKCNGELHNATIWKK
ncbi:hypothetical protein QEW_0532 [Clostridioides difficile CD160]|nr:hypothetical protein QEW_0532 [Clostridioides difficile CD160]